MKKILFLIIALATINGLFASQGMVITQTYKDAANKDASITVTWYITATQCKLKMAYSDGKVNTNNWFIPDMANGQILAYSDGTAPNSQKSYYTIPVQNVKGNADVTRVIVSKTGETKSVGGVACEKVLVKTNRGETEMWVTTGFKPDFYRFASYFQSSIELLGLSQDGLQGVPLESVTHDNGGVVTSSYTLISAVTADISDAEFKVPAEFKAAGEPAGK